MGFRTPYPFRAPQVDLPPAVNQVPLGKRNLAWNRYILLYGKSSRAARLSARPERGIPFRDEGAGRDKKAAIKELIDAFLLK